MVVLLVGTRWFVGLEIHWQHLSFLPTGYIEIQGKIVLKFRLLHKSNAGKNQNHINHLGLIFLLCGKIY